MAGLTFDKIADGINTEGCRYDPVSSGVRRVARRVLAGRKKVFCKNTAHIGFRILRYRRRPDLKANDSDGR